VPSRRFARSSCAALFVTLGFAPLGCNVLTADHDGRPNVLLVTIDTLRADRVGAYGARDVGTPTLDLLAARGVLFEQAMAAVPLTLPSHASILTGQYPPSHGVRHNAIFRLSDEAETLAEAFRAAGYATGAVVGAAVLDPSFGLTQGFDHYDAEYPEDRASSGGFFERPAQAVTDAALAWLRENDDRFFLWVHYYDPHASYHPPEPFKGRFRGRPYDGEVAYTDRELGRLLRELETSGALADTVVAVTADHGEGLGEHGESTHIYLIYDSVLRVPLIVAGPGVPPGRRVPTVVPNTGLAATLLELARAPALAKTDVASLAPLWAAQPGATGPFGWAYAESLAGELDHGWAPLHAIRSDVFHYIRAPRAELFDLAQDPRQRRNVLPSQQPAHEATVQRGEQRIGELLTRSAELARVDVDADTRARIEALGYVVSSRAVEKTGDDPKDVHHYADLWYEALGLYFEKKYDRAEEIALRALEKLPHSSQLHDVLARVYVETGRPELALKHAVEATRLNSGWADYQAQVAFVHVLLGKLPEAVAAFERTLALDPNNAGAHLGLMWRRKLGGSVEEADEHARRALELGANRAALFERVGEVWEFLGEYDRALATYQQGLEQFPNHAPLQMRLAIQYARFGDERRAQRARDAAGTAAADVNLRNRLAIVYAARREFDRAEPIFRDILKERPDEPSTKRYLARMLRETGRGAEAEKLVEGLAPAPLAPPPPASPTELPPRG
jgi:choline-sulfatase